MNKTIKALELLTFNIKEYVEAEYQDKKFNIQIREDLALEIWAASLQMIMTLLKLNSY